MRIAVVDDNDQMQDIIKTHITKAIDEIDDVEIQTFSNAESWFGISYAGNCKTACRKYCEWIKISRSKISDAKEQIEDAIYRVGSLLKALKAQDK